jgi:phospholipase D1/2
MHVLRNGLSPVSLIMAVQSNDTKDKLKTAGERYRRKGSLVKFSLIFLLLLAVPIAWRWTPLNEWINFDTVIAWQQSIRNHPAALYLVVGVYVLGGLVLFPVVILNVATVFVFGPILGNGYALAGWLASASMGYGIGHATGGQMVQKLAQSWLDRLIRSVDRHGFLTVLTLRVFPVAPFTLVNVFIGSSGIRFRDFFLASLIGRIPGVILLGLASVQVETLLRGPDAVSLVMLGLPLMLLPLALNWLKRVLKDDRGKTTSLNVDGLPPVRQEQSLSM